MLKALYALVTVAFCVCLLLSFERPAMAYIDPGSGLFVFQSISSIGVGVLFFMRRRLRSLFRRSKNETVPVAEGSAVPADATYQSYKSDKAA